MRPVGDRLREDGFDVRVLTRDPKHARVSLGDSYGLVPGDVADLYDGPASVERAKRVLPNGRAELLAECNHAIVSGQTEIVTARLLEFLASPVEAELSPGGSLRS